ncbi:MAG: PorT family protein [Phaeodactylibacter sp.]|nr:PorT family protein [Phaeodactylibacter sp.]
MQRLALLALLIFAFSIPDADAQQHKQLRFTAGALLGINASQLDGDDQSGYSKNGIVGGLRGIAHLTPRFDFNVELLYAQRGSKPSAKGNNGERPVTILLNYAETPFLITFKTAEDWDGNYRLQLSTGLSYARLLNSKVEETSGNTPNIAGNENKFKKNDISWKAGLAYLITPKLSLGVRHTFSLTPLLKENAISSESRNSLRSYYLNLHLAYTL